MKKILSIGWKDLITLFQDRGALILMLGAPFVLTLGLGLVTGAFSDSNSGTGLADIPVVLVNLDEGEMGAALVELFNSAELADLIEPVTAVSPTTARDQVNNNQMAAAVIIPADFSTSIIPNQTTGRLADPIPIEIYANPARPISAGIIQTFVDNFINQVETGMLSVNVTMSQLIASGNLSTQNQTDLMAAGNEIGARLFEQTQAESNELIKVEQDTETAVNDDFNLLAYLAPAMAVLFLMYTVTQGARSILTERDAGTLARLLITPTSSSQVLGGKVVGIFLSGFAQVAILIVACSLLFGLQWGYPLGVLLLIIAVSAAATGWGILLAAIADKPHQINSIGTSLMLVFGVVGGSFFQVASSGPLAWLSKITPNAWAIEGFATLGNGGSLVDILPALIALTCMAILLFISAVIIFQRRSHLQF